MLYAADKFDNIKSEFPSLLVECCGIVSAACKKAGISRETFYNWLKVDPIFKASIENMEDATHGYVEDVLKSMVVERNEKAVFFYLKTKGKHLGYAEEPKAHFFDKQIDVSEYKSIDDDFDVVAQYKASIMKQDNEMKVVSE